MRRRGWTLGFSGGALVALALALSPALGASNDLRAVKPKVLLTTRNGLGSFTPASSDARLAAVLARGGLSGSGFRFTPASTSASIRLNRSVTVAVRAGTNLGVPGGERFALVGAPSSSIAPVAYNLGVAVGWKRFAVSSDVAKVDLGLMGGRESADIGVSYNAQSWTTRLAVGNEHPITGTPRALSSGMAAYSLDLGGSFRLSRNLDLTAGVRYRAPERDRLELTDDRRDSQAVYIGTAFKF
ncbi:hypothetical protein [Sphingomonas sp.]|uniref:hypothetical protein n=1 Tax=Sphingomonas sp. TaxID=28214 RepID=UPI0025F69887|nr:hypothetical protein [Sphingomonas sp.]